LVVLMGDLVAQVMGVHILRRGVVMTGVVMLKPCLDLYGRRRAKDHGCRRVALEGYGEHHEPKQDCANHVKNSKPCLPKRQETRV
jgi:hypothetical protein